MSAFVVSKEHIDLLVDVAIHGPRGRTVEPGYNASLRWYNGEPQTVEECREMSRDAKDVHPDELGMMLLAENIASVRYRYADNDPDGMVPGWVMEDGYSFGRGPRYRLTAVEALKAIDCYQYQACEHSEWRTSEAKYFTDTLRNHITGYVPGYDDAPWEWTDREVAAGRVAV